MECSEASAKNSKSLPLLFHQSSHGSNINESDNKLEEVESNNTASFSKTLFNGLNALSGVGIVSIPYALASGGWASLLLFFGIAVTAFYTGLLMKRCMDSDGSIRSYPDIGERAFRSKGRALVSVLTYAELYMVSTGFLILEGDNLNTLFPGLGKQMFVIIAALIILPSVWMDDLSLLSYVSATGVLASVIILGSIVGTGSFDGVGFREKGKMVRWNGIPTALNLYAFCFCAHPVFPSLYTSMNNKKQFSNVLVLCFILCTMSYASMAIFGYLMFGSDVKSQITLSLPISKLSSKVAIYTTLINPIAKYALMVKPIVDAIKLGLPCPMMINNNRIHGLMIGTTIVITSVAVALSVPFFSALMSLVGALLSVAGSIVIPCLCYMRISGAHLRGFGFEITALVGIVFFGLAMAVVGTYAAIQEIIANFGE